MWFMITWEGRFRASTAGIEDKGFALRFLDVESEIPGYEGLMMSWIVSSGVFCVFFHSSMSYRSSKLSDTSASELTESLNCPPQDLHTGSGNEFLYTVPFIG